ncbi:MAG: hypothetical protein PVI00_06980 [Desulfobacterales bacterium]
MDLRANPAAAIKPGSTLRARKFAELRVDMRSVLYYSSLGGAQRAFMGCNLNDPTDAASDHYD